MGSLRVPRNWQVLVGAAVVAGLNLFAVAWVLTGPRINGVDFDGYRIDLDVYRMGVEVWWNGGDIYGRIPDTRVGLNLPFLYPPFSLLVLGPFAVPPFEVASVLWTLLSIAALAVVVLVVLRSLGVRRAWWWTAALLPFAVFTEPVTDNLNFGQINLFLMALVVVDCLAKSPRWPRGLLIGLAAAVKLTPLAFLLLLLLRRDFRAMATSLLTFAACSVIGVLVSWQDSVRFWSGGMFTTDRVGVGFAGNQSITAVLVRLGAEPPLRSVLWLALSAAVLALATVAVRKALAEGDLALAVCFNALTMMLVSPISWSNHWVWCVPLVLALAKYSKAAAAAAVALFYLAPQWSWPSTNNREQDWTLWQQVVGSGYVVFAVLLLLLAATRVAQRPSRSTVDDDRPLVLQS